MTRFIRSKCRIEFPEGSPYEDNTIEPGHAASNGDTWRICRMNAETGKTEYVDSLTECRVIGDESDLALLVTGQSTYLAETGVPEDERAVTIKVVQNPKFR